MGARKFSARERPAVQRRVVEGRQDGVLCKQLAYELGVSRVTVWKLWRDACLTSSLLRGAEGSGKGVSAVPRETVEA